MEIYQIEIIEPKAKKLLDELVNLNLIKMKSLDKTKQDFIDILKEIRAKSENELSLEEITEEVELVRKQRYE